MSPLPLGILALSGAVGGGAYELIESQVLASSAASVTFSSIPQDYKHLQIRAVIRTDRAASGTNVQAHYNSDTGGNYRFHNLYGTGASVFSNDSGASATRAIYKLAAAASSVANNYSPMVADILDYSSTTKNTTTRVFHGFDDPNFGGSEVGLQSSVWLNTAALTSITFTDFTAANLGIGTRFSLYGIRG